MQHDCYRCHSSMEEQTAFCPACGAPQIRVRTPEQPIEHAALPDVELTPEQLVSIPGQPANLVSRSKIQWKSFTRTAAPLAALTGMLTALLPPLGFFILFPASLIVSIRIYQRRRPILTQGSQGARMGALMALLSFVFFTIFFLGAIFLNQVKYREIIVNRLQEMMAQNPDQQAQQIFQWFMTTNGLIVFTAIFLITALIFFLLIGMGSGALAVTMGRPRNRPQL